MQFKSLLQKVISNSGCYCDSNFGFKCVIQIRVSNVCFRYMFQIRVSNTCLKCKPAWSQYCAVPHLHACAPARPHEHNVMHNHICRSYKHAQHAARARSADCWRDTDCSEFDLLRAAGDPRLCRSAAGAVAMLLTHTHTHTHTHHAQKQRHM